MTPDEKEHVWDGIRARLDERKAAHEEQQRQQRITKLVAWIRRKGGK